MYIVQGPSGPAPPPPPGGSCGSPQWKGDNYCDDENNNEGCEWDGGDCCGDDVNTTYCSVCECLDPNGSPAPPPPPPPPPPSPPSPPSPPGECASIPTWMVAEGRIVGGEAAPEAIPWQVSVRSCTSGNCHFCGGTILDAETVMCAAHCFSLGQNMGGKYIRAGVVDRYDNSGQVSIFFN